MKEIYQAFRSAGVEEMESIKVTDSFNKIVNRLNKELSRSESRFVVESNRLDKEILINRILSGIIVAAVVIPLFQ